MDSESRIRDATQKNIETTHAAQKNIETTPTKIKERFPK